MCRVLLLCTFFFAQVSAMKNIEWHSTIGSTNDLALQRGKEGVVHGYTIGAKYQNTGRGRLGRPWASPPGTGLYCSTIIRPEIEIHDYPLLTFVAGLAVAEAIEKQYELSPGLKWPNDIYFGRKKCGGILTETSNLSQLDKQRFAVVGIGLNVNTETTMFPEEIRSTSTSLSIESGANKAVSELFITIREQLLGEVSFFVKYGFEPVIERWRERDIFLGERLEWVTAGGKIVDGISLGPDDRGLLHVKDDQGRVHEVLSGDIRLVK